MMPDNARLAALYGENRVLYARQRIDRVRSGFAQRFAENHHTPSLFSVPGRTELGGNHTDHQHGCVLCAAVDVDLLACAAPNDLHLVRICSEGYPPVEVDVRDMSFRTEEKGTSSALVRGIASRITQLGHCVGGFDAYMVSDVLSGSGLSSSAAYEVLVATILNHFFCRDMLDAVSVAQIGQWAENEYFGKPCGLMDQIGCAVGGAVSVDFQDPSNPVVIRLNYDFDKSGYALCIVDTHSSHDDLTEDYVAIPREMEAVAACFGKTYLRDVDEHLFRNRLSELRLKCGDRPVLRAMHFFAENRRAQQEYSALERQDFEGYLSLVRQSGLSSETLLQNISSLNYPEHQAVAFALAAAKEFLGEKGAVRVHGGGFAGTIQAFVPSEIVEQFKAYMDKVLGENACQVMRIRPMGAAILY